MTSTRDSEPWTPSDAPLALAHRASDILGRLASSRWWAWWAVLLAVVLGVFLASPALHAPDADAPGWVYVRENSGPQLFDPAVAATSQQANTTFRVVPRLIGAAFSLSHPWQFLLVQLGFGLVFLWTAAKLYAEALRDRISALLLVIALGSTWAGATAWLEVRGLFDAIALALLALSMRARRLPVVVVVLVLAGFTDERAVLATPLVVAWHALRPPTPGDRADARGTLDDDRRGLRPFLRPVPLAAAATVGIHLMIRTWLKHRYGLSEGANRSPGEPFSQLSNYPNGLWGALEGVWLVVAAGLMGLRRHRGTAAAGLAALAAIPILLAGVSVFDISRAVAYVWPLAPLACVGLRHVPRDWLRRAVAIAATVTVVWPVIYASDENTVQWVYPLPLALVERFAGVG